MNKTTGAQELARAVRTLKVAGIPGAPADARRLLAHALGIGTDRVTLVLPDTITDQQASAFHDAIARRAAREPVSHITGLRQFWGRDFVVSADVLDPRPETEILVVQALTAPFTRVLDLGTGSGALLLTLLAQHPTATGLGTDLSSAALDVARGNARRLGITADFAKGSWLEAVPPGMTFDLIVSNPPYIAAAEMPGLAPELGFEPRMALTDDADGLVAYRTIAQHAAAYLAPGGRILLEHGPTQGPAVANLFAGPDFTDSRTIADLDGRKRCFSARKPL